MTFPVIENYDQKNSGTQIIMIKTETPCSLDTSAIYNDNNNMKRDCKKMRRKTNIKTEIVPINIVRT